jgi:uncharacterized membrane protein
VSLYDWLLFLHVLGAFALVGALTLISIVIVATWRAERPSDIAEFAGVTRVGRWLVGAGTSMTIVFGVWLAIEVDQYRVWDGWVIAAIVLWAIAAETGRRAVDAVRGGRRAVGMQLASSAAVLVILVDMIWKPGA